MIDLKRDLPHWTSLCSAVQVLVNFGLVYSFFTLVDSESASEEKWMYFVVANALTVSTLLVNIALMRENFLRSTFNITSIFIYTYMLPMTMLTSSLSPTMALIGPIIYNVLIICVAPVHIACLTFIGGAVFAYQFPNFSGVEIDTIYKPLLAYLAMTGVAMLWRSLFIKLIIGYLHLTDKDPSKESMYETRIKELEEERQLLRSEIITHVVELNEAALSHQPEKREGQ
ncbi:MAG: hypothetical protein MK132_05165 [Lentisphaerales bacterium]|nr:hypothetical protein [Lentisphaerales bacterium]